MKNSRMLVLIVVSVLLATAIGVTWVVAQSNTELKGSYEGRRIVYKYCPAGGSNFCIASCPEGFILVGGGGGAYDYDASVPVASRSEPYCSDDSQGCAYADADAWKIDYPVSSVLPNVGGTSFAMCFQERFGSFIPMVRGE